MDSDFLKRELNKKEKIVQSEKVKDVTKPELPPINFEERYGTLQNQINNARETFKKQIAELKEAIETRKKELELYELKLHKLEGAVEASDIYLKEVPPSNAKS